MKIGTFSKTGEKILEFAKQHPEYNWVFKPHPNLKNQLSIDKNYGLDFVNKYYSEWANLGELHEQGNYFDLFINSDLMITDSSSFLLEYMPTGKPIFRLERKDSVPLTSFGEELRKHLYKISDFSSFEKTFEKVIVNKNDALKEKRLSFINKILGNMSCSELIIKNLISILEMRHN